ncbi:LPXTG_cell wall anchor domain-containing protein [Hexamita inflata]|uniref:LPXTG cell wall anchor domain-containing protein n=1 Tax=Hexamita inflata TaxID=28002 RepID=A0AA86TQ63_9EUKA|nr:LPXTG cell wall anchor domain-containing protein [Hexamita inflata]
MESTIQNSTMVQCAQDQSLVQKYKNQVISRVLEIEQDEFITNLQFVESFKLKELICKQCDNISFQTVPINLKKLIIIYSRVKNLTGIKQMTQLKVLDIYIDYHLCDISELSNLRNLTKLSLQSNNIEDISALKELKLLNELNLNNNKIKSIKPLENLTKLLQLQFISNKIEDLYPIRNLTKLTKLSFKINLVNDISVLKYTTNIRKLSFDDNQVVDISTLSSLKQISALSFCGNKVVQIESLNKLNKLNDLYIIYNFIIDLPLFKNKNVFQKQCQLEGIDYDHAVIQKLPTSALILFAMKQKAILQYKEQVQKSSRLKQQFVTKPVIFRSKIKDLVNKMANSQVQFMYHITLMFQKLSQNQEYE